MRVYIFYVVRMLLVLDVLRDRVHRARTVQSDARDNILEAGRPEVLHEVRHASALELEHALGVAVCYQLIYFRVVITHLRPVYGDTVVLLDHAQSVSDDRKVTEPQEVHLEKSELLDGRHVELCRDALVRRVKRHIFIKRQLGDDNAGSVRRSMTRQSFKSHRQVEHLLYKRLVLVSSSQLRIDLKSLCDSDPELIRDGFGYLIALSVRRVESPRDIAYSRFGLESTESDDLRHLVPAVLSVDVLDDLLPSLDAEVDVYIRHADSLRVQEPLEDQVVFDRIYLRYIQAVRYDAACSRASARSDSDLVRLGIVDEIPHDEEVLDISHVLDDGKLHLEALSVARIRVHGRLAVSADEAFIAQFAEVLIACHAFRRHVLRQMVLAKSKFDVAPLCYLVCSLDSIRDVREECFHLVLGLDVELIIFEPDAVLIMYVGLRLDAHQDVLRCRILAPYVVSIIRRNKRNADIRRQPLEPGNNGLVLFEMVILYLKEEIVLAEYVEELQRLAFCSLIVPVQEHPLRVAGKAARQADEAFAVLPQEVLVDPRPEVEAVNITLRDDLDQVAVTLLGLGKQYEVARVAVLARFLVVHRPRSRIHLAADDWLDARLFAGFIEIDHTEHGAMISNGARIHPEPLHIFRQLGDPAHPVEQAVFSMDV